MREVAEVQKELDAQKSVPRIPQLLSELGSDREGIYERYQRAETPPAEEEVRTEEVKTEEVKTEEVKTEAEFVKEAKPQEEEKTVPYGALKEERDKRKSLATKVRELEETVKQSLEDNKKLVELMSSKSEEEPITDYEKTMRDQAKHIKLLEQRLQSFETNQKQTAEKTAQQTLVDRVKVTDKELSEEGFDGFKDFTQAVITEMNDEEIPLEDRDESVWKRVYKDKVYPKYIGKYKPASKKEEKIEAKKDAALIKSPGKPETKKKEESGDPNADYAKWRKSISFFNAPS